ncbi:hypothetical protein F5X99DRAFT_375291 [Biscogniauxia marginata]|nr:hypothetical protein F5X99DRAFT_375291 [Biscogniauxia marginata]
MLYLVQKSNLVTKMHKRSNFWTSSMKRGFHEAVSQLRKINDNPEGQKDYRDDFPLHSEGYILTLHDERQLADDIAFLAHTKDEVYSISAVTILEKSGGITLILASNRTPTDLTVSVLRKILSLVKNYSITGKHKHRFYEEIFDAIVELCENRIIGRIQPQPRNNSQRPSLLSQVQDFLGRIDLTQNVPPELLEKARELAGHLRHLQGREHEKSSHDLLKSIITKCVEISAIGGTGSVENDMQSLGFPQTHPGWKWIQRIDKLSRYSYISKNLVKFARKESYLSLFRNIDLVRISSYPPNYPLETSVPHFVHAEMQQILYHEQFPSIIHPRVIGCSKSACYLCDLFIQKQGLYRISIAHGRLYHMWTLPDVDWMDMNQVNIFSKVIMDMTRILRDTIATLHRTKYPPRPYGIESRARLPLSSGSTLSKISRITDQVATINLSTASGLHSKENPPSHARKSVSTTIMSNSDTEKVSKTTDLSGLGSKDSVISAKLSREDLPFFRDIHGGVTIIDIEISSVRLYFDFTCVSMGCLRISQSATQEKCSPTVDVASIQSEKEVKIGCIEDGSSVKFQLVHKTYPRVNVEFIWGAPKEAQSPTISTSRRTTFSKELEENTNEIRTTREK